MRFYENAALLSTQTYRTRYVVALFFCFSNIALQSLRWVALALVNCIVNYTTIPKHRSLTVLQRMDSEDFRRIRAGLTLG